MKKDKIYMRRTLSLARRGLEKTSPNPLVRAVIAKKRQIIGKGYHRGYGLPQAEVEAIERCCHNTPQKKTPPCTERIIREGIKFVVAACVDPNPPVNGKGIAAFRETGIEVTTGILEKKNGYRAVKGTMDTTSILVAGG